MSSLKTFLLCALLLASSVAVYSVIEMKAIYPSTFYDNQNLLVENGLMVTIQEIDDIYGTMKVYDAQNPALPELLSTTTVWYRSPRKAFLYNEHVYIPDMYGHRMRRYSLLDPINPVLNYEYQYNMVDYRDMTFSGNYLLMSSQSLGMRVINISSENHATEVGSYASTNPLFRVWAHQNRAAVLSYNMSSENAVLILLDISDPANPVNAGTIELPNYEYNDYIEVVFYQHYLHLELSGNYTEVYSLSIPNIPMWVGDLGDYGLAHGVILDNIRYSHNRNLFRVQQLIEPLTPVEIASFELLSIDDERCFIDLPYAYVIRDGYSYCLDLSNLEPPEALVYTFDSGVNGDGLAGYQDWLYYSGNIAQISPQAEIVGSQTCPALSAVKDIKVDQGLLHTLSNSELTTNIFTLSEPANPQLLATISGSSKESWKFGDYFIKRGTSTIGCFNISDPANPVYLWTLSRSVKSLTMEGDLLWVVWLGELETYSVASGQPLLICSQPLIYSLQVFNPTLTKHGSYIYISGYANEIQVYDVSNPYSSTYAGRAALLVSGDASDRAPFITPEGKMLIVTGLANQVILYDLDDPTFPQYIAHHSLPYKPFRIVFRDDRFLFKRANLIYCMQMPGTVATSDPALVPPLVQVWCQPNPFSSHSQISIRTNHPTPGIVAVYNLKGQKIKTLHAGILPAGTSELVWDGRDERGRDCASGIYLVRMLSERRLAGTAKVTLLK